MLVLSAILSFERSLRVRFGNMGHSPFKVNLDLIKKSGIYHNSKTEHLKISKNAKFGFEIFDFKRNSTGRT